MNVAIDLARAVGAFNTTTGRSYQGGNVDRLAEAAVLGGYDLDKGWAGFHQWRDAGRIVRKGEHGTHCLTIVTVEADPETGNAGTRKPRGFVVFHYDQTEPLEEVTA